MELLVLLGQTSLLRIQLGLVEEALCQAPVAGQRYLLVELNVLCLKGPYRVMRSGVLISSTIPGATAPRAHVWPAAAPKPSSSPNLEHCCLFLKSKAISFLAHRLGFVRGPARLCPELRQTRIPTSATVLLEVTALNIRIPISKQVAAALEK